MEYVSPEIRALNTSKSAFARGLLGFFQITNWASGVTLIIMMVMMTADALGRYLFAFPIPGTQEIVANYVLVGTVWLSLARTEMNDGHVAIDIVLRRFPERMQLLISILIRPLAVIPIALVFWGSFSEMAKSFGARVLGPVAIPVSLSWGLIAFGAASLILALLTGAVLRILEFRRGPQPSAVSDSSSDGPIEGRYIDGL